MTFIPNPSESGQPPLETFWKKTYRPSLKNPQVQQPTLLGHGLITASLLLLNLGLASGLSYFASRQAVEWSVLDPALQSASQSASQSALQPTGLTSKLQERLAAQLVEVQSRRNRHKDVMLYFYRQYFVMLSMASGTALAATLFAFFISRDGWEKANNGLINAFFVTSSAAVLYTQIPVLFQQELNLKANRIKYLEYSAFEEDILSYLAIHAATNPTEKGNETKLTKFILTVDQRLATLNQIPLDFDATQVIPLPNLQQFGLPKSLPPSLLPRSAPLPQSSQSERDV